MSWWINADTYSGNGPAKAGSVDQAYIPDPPTVPNYDGGGPGMTATNTEALSQFATNIKDLLPLISNAQTFLNYAIPLAPGGFKAANDLKTSYQSLASAYTDVLKDLNQGVTDLGQATGTMIKTYTTADELNNANVNDVTNDLQQVTQDFSNMMAVKPGASSGPSSGGNGPSA